MDTLGRPVQDQFEPIEAASTGCDRRPVEIAPPQPDLRLPVGRIVAAAIAALVLGAIGGWVVASGRSSEVAPVATRTAPAVVPADVAGTAEVFTSLYLTGSASAADLAAIYPGEAPSPTTTWVNTSRTVAGQLFDDGHWGVIVVVDSLESIAGEYQPVPLRYFLVPVSTDSGRPIVAAAPAQIPPPTAISTPESLPSPIPADQAETAARFIELYLTGEGAVARDLAATARVSPFTPAPYVSALATAQGAGRQDSVQVAVEATNQHGTTHDLQYTVFLTSEDGTWKVSDLEDGVD